MTVTGEADASKTPPKKRLTAKGVGKALSAMVGVVVTVLGALGISICAIYQPYHFPERVTILVPVQGEASDQQAPPYASKISRDTVTIVDRARRLYERNNHALGDSVVFEHYPEGADARSRYDQAIEQIARAEKQGRPAVAVIGHTTSQATLDAGPAYAEHGLTILMPYATRTGISRELCALEANANPAAHRHRPFALAFPPPNSQQAVTIAAFLRERLLPKDATTPAGSSQDAPIVPKVVLFRDALNAAYSADCANRLEELLEEVPKGKDEPPIEVIADISAGGASGQWYISSELVAAKPDAVVVIGGTKVAVEVLRQAKAVGLKPRLTILTDGAVDLNLVSRVKQALPMNSTSDAGTGEVFVTFPESDVVPEGYALIFHEKTSATQNIRGLSHAAFVSDAVYMTMISVRNGRAQSIDCWKQIVDKLWHRKPTGPATLFLNHLQTAMSATVGSKGYTISAGMLLSDKRTYDFSEIGARSEANLQYYVYRLVREEAVDDRTHGYEPVPLAAAERK